MTNQPTDRPTKDGQILNINNCYSAQKSLANCFVKSYRFASGRIRLMAIGFKGICIFKDIVVNKYIEYVYTIYIAIL